MLIATRDREPLLTTRALPSVLGQQRRSDAVVIVNDGPPLRAALPPGVVVLSNQRSPGVAGAWNTGLAHLWRVGHRGFIALLDDDDEWDAEHLAANAACAAAHPGASIVISGLRMVVAGREQPRPLLRTLCDRDFLVGNPGWQGSNTFVALAALAAVGGFREGLPSLNDRDLAVRLLRHVGTRWALTGRWTATWHRDTPASLSSPGSPAKRRGLRWFWRIYGAEMTPAEVAAFFERAERLFEIPRHTILAFEDDAPPRCHSHGDWHVAE